MESKRALQLLQQMQLKWLDNNRVIIGIKNIVTKRNKRAFKLIVMVDGERICTDCYTGCFMTELWLARRIGAREMYIRNALMDNNQNTND